MQMEIEIQQIFLKVLEKQKQVDNVNSASVYNCSKSTKTLLHPYLFLWKCEEIFSTDFNATIFCIIRTLKFMFQINTDGCFEHTPV